MLSSPKSKVLWMNNKCFDIPINVQGDKKKKKSVCITKSWCVQTKYNRDGFIDWLLLNVQRAVFQLYSGREQVQLRIAINSYNNI